MLARSLAFLLAVSTAVLAKPTPFGFFTNNTILATAGTNYSADYPRFVLFTPWGPALGENMLTYCGDIQVHRIGKWRHYRHHCVLGGIFPHLQGS
jgi:hypothetical protein